jgi:hypothetical protein
MIIIKAFIAVILKPFAASLLIVILQVIINLMEGGE